MFVCYEHSNSKATQHNIAFERARGIKMSQCVRARKLKPDSQRPPNMKMAMEMSRDMNFMLCISIVH